MEQITTSPLSMIVSEIEIAYKSKIKASEWLTVTSSKSVYDIFLATWNMNTIDLLEEFKIMLLNRHHKVLGILPVSVGGFTGTVADPRVIFGAALKAACCSLVLAHNHPSQNLQPSHADEELTRRLIEAGKLFDIRVLDHLIITPNAYLSMADEGLM